MEIWYHACGYPILVSSLAKHGNVVRVFFDSDPQWAQRTTTECPGCDRPLYLSNLIPDFEYDDTDGENEALDQ